MSTKLAKRTQFAGNSPVRYSITGPPEKPTGILLGFDYELAPIPEHYYVADFFQLVPFDLSVLLIFGKLDHPKMDRLRNKIEIYFPADMFVRQLWKSSRDFQKTLHDYVESCGAEAVPPGTISPETDKVQTLEANNVLMVLSAGQSLMDFFYMSAKDFWLRPSRNEPIGLEAIVRVLLSPSLLLGFVRAADQVAQPYVERLKIEEEGKDETVESK